MLQVYGLLYYSFADPELDTGILQVIMQRARNRNYLNHVTGQLHFENGMFLQWLEGDKNSILEIYSYIKRDPHHSGIKEIFFGTVPARNFEGWEMGYSDHNNASLLSFISSNQVRLDQRDAVTVSRLVEFLVEAAEPTNQSIRRITLPPDQPGMSPQDYIHSTAAAMEH